MRSLKDITTVKSCETLWLTNIISLVECENVACVVLNAGSICTCVCVCLYEVVFACVVLNAGQYLYMFMCAFVWIFVCVCLGVIFVVVKIWIKLERLVNSFLNVLQHMPYSFWMIMQGSPLGKVWNWWYHITN